MATKQAQAKKAAEPKKGADAGKKGAEAGKKGAEAGKKGADAGKTTTLVVAKKKIEQKRLFKHWVEIGRIVLINYGPDEGKIAVIVDVIDQNRAYIDGPLTGVLRQAINFKRLTLTKLKIPIVVHSRRQTIIKAWKEAKIKENWAKSSLARRLSQRKHRANMTDFDRFKAMLAKKHRNSTINQEVNKIIRAFNLKKKATIEDRERREKSAASKAEYLKKLASGEIKKKEKPTDPSKAKKKVPKKKPAKEKPAKESKEGTEKKPVQKKKRSAKTPRKPKPVTKKAAPKTEATKKEASAKEAPKKDEKQPKKGGGAPKKDGGAPKKDGGAPKKDGGAPKKAPAKGGKK